MYEDIVQQILETRSDSSVERYMEVFGPIFRAICKQSNLAPFEIADLTCDLLTDTFLRLEKYGRECGPFDLWVMRVARIRVIDTVRRGHHSLATVPLKAAKSVAEPEPKPVTQVERDRCYQVRNALAQLDSMDTEILVMRSEEELTFAEVAQRLGIKEGAARSRAFRASKRLRSILERVPGILRGGGVSAGQ